MSQERYNLRAKLAVKRIRLLSLVAKKHGLGELKKLSLIDVERVAALTDEILKDWDQTHRAGTSATQDDAAFNRLAREYYEIQKQLNDA